MQAIMVSGSRRAASRETLGKTQSVGEALLRGIEDAGGATERTFLPELRIEHCRQCEANGWGRCRSAGQCVIEDDLAAVAAQLARADIAILCTPVYYGDLSESMRALLDRLRRVANHAPDHLGLKGKPAVGITVAGGGGGGSVTAAVSLERALVTTGFEILDMIPVRVQNLPNKLEVLPAVGRWLVEVIEARLSQRA
jgi:multimeric flavodoxin WrbA